MTGQIMLTAFLIQILYFKLVIAIVVTTTNLTHQIKHQLVNSNESFPIRTSDHLNFYSNSTNPNLGSTNVNKTNFYPNQNTNFIENKNLNSNFDRNNTNAPISQFRIKEIKEATISNANRKLINIQNYVNYNDEQVESQSDLNSSSDAQPYFLIDLNQANNSSYVLNDDFFNANNVKENYLHNDSTRSNQSDRGEDTLNRTQSDYLTYFQTSDQLTLDLIFDQDDQVNNVSDDEVFNENLIKGRLSLQIMNQNNLETQSNRTDEINNSKNPNISLVRDEFVNHRERQNDQSQIQTYQHHFSSLLNQPNHHQLEIDYFLSDDESSFKNDNYSTKFNQSSSNEQQFQQTANSTASTTELVKQEKVYWGLALIVLPISAVFGNSLVILAVFREKSLRSVTNYFIVSLAFADLLVAGVVMPFAVYYLVNIDWELSMFLCDFWMSVDVMCSTASILNLVAISIDRYIAVTQPIKYSKHKSNNRVALTIAFVWIVSFLIGSPIWLGLNTSEEKNSNVCIFVNSDFIIYSSLGSFYIPCVLMIFLYYRIFKEIRKRAKRSHAKSSTTPSSGHQNHQKIDSAKIQTKQTDQQTKADLHKITSDRLTKPTVDTTSSQQGSNSDENQTANKQQIKTNIRKFIPLVGNRKPTADKVTVNVTKSEIDDEDEEEDSELTGSDQQQGGKTSEVLVSSTKQTPTAKKDAKGFYFKKIIQSDKNNNQLDKQAKKGISAIIKSTKSLEMTKQSNEDALIIANVSALNIQEKDNLQSSSSTTYSTSTSKARRLIGRFALSSKLKTEDELTTLDLDYLNTLPSVDLAATKTIDSKLGKERTDDEIEDESSSELMNDEFECKVINNNFVKDNINTTKSKVPTTIRKFKASTIARSISVPLESGGICVDCGQLCTHSKTFENLNNKMKENFNLNQNQADDSSCIVDIVADFCHENNEVEILMENASDANQKQKLLPKQDNEELKGEESVEILVNRGARLTDPELKDTKKLTCICDHQLVDNLEESKLVDKEQSRKKDIVVDSKQIDKVELAISKKQQSNIVTTTMTNTIITTSTTTGSSSSNSVKPVSTINATTNGYLMKSTQDDEQQSSNENAVSKQPDKSFTTAVRSTDQLSKKKSRFNLGRKQKNSRKKREKASAKRERKATKTLAIVLGCFLFCWVPFFSLNIYDAICIKLQAEDCKLGVSAFLYVTWLGYINSSLNPVIYTIFNDQYRKSFKKMLCIS